MLHHTADLGDRGVFVPQKKATKDLLGMSLGTASLTQRPRYKVCGLRPLQDWRTKGLQAYQW